MYENKLLFHGDHQTLQATKLLFSFGVIHTDKKSQAVMPFFSVQTRKFGQAFQQKLHLQGATPQSETVVQAGEAFLIYKYISFDEALQLKKIADLDVHFKIYILAHRLFQLSEVLQIIITAGITKERIIFICLASHLSSSVYTDSELKLYFDHLLLGHEKVILPYKANKEVEIKDQSAASFLPYFLIQFTQMLLSPWQQMKASQVIWVKRIFEFLDFLTFQKTKLNPLLSFFRHSTLMSGFRFYGWIVDSYNFIERNLVRIYYQIFFKIFIRSYFLIRHAVLMTVFKSYGVGVDLFYLSIRILKIIYYVVIGQIRHALLMVIYKGYGLTVDAFYLSYRILQKTAFYPIFKIYWFLEFQYNKRIKRIV